MRRPFSIYETERFVIYFIRIILSIDLTATLAGPPRLLGRELRMHLRRWTVLYFLACALSVVAVHARPQGPFVTVVTRPASGAAGAAEVIGRAGGTIAAATGRDWITIAYSEEPGFPSRLRAAGALAVLGVTKAAGCRGRV